MSKFIGSIIVYIKNNNLFQLKFIFPSTNESHKLMLMKAIYSPILNEASKISYLKN